METIVKKEQYLAMLALKKANAPYVIQEIIQPLSGQSRLSF